jgi:hypothetical protein
MLSVKGKVVYIFKGISAEMSKHFVSIILKGLLSALNIFDASCPSVLLKSKYFNIILFSIFFFHSNSATADIGHYTIPPEASVPFPEKNDHILLDTVFVTINADKKSNTINSESIFNFQNTSDEPQSVIMGFPIVTLRGLGVSGLNNFKVKVGLKEQEILFISENVSKYKDIPTDYSIVLTSNNESFKIYQHPDGKDKEKTIWGGVYTTIIYWEYLFSRKQHQKFIIEYQANNWKSILYVIDTAASWKGDVKNMIIKIKYPIHIPFHYLNLYPSGCEYRTNEVEWNFKNYDVSMGRQIGAILIDDKWIEEDINSFPKDFFKYRSVENVNYKLDKQYFHYYAKISQEENDSIELVKSPEYVLNEVSLIRNEIYARKGYTFKNSKYQNYFSKKTWYKPDPKFSFSKLNYIEKRNANYLKSIEEAIANFPQEFNHYFEGEDILGYDCWHGDGCNFLDDKYFRLKNQYINTVESCYERHLP